MGAKILKHHDDILDGTKGKYRITLQARKSSFLSDGHAADHDEGVVVTCPSCGCQFGVGFDADGPKIVDGKTDRPVKCMNPMPGRCSWSDYMEFDLHTSAEVRGEVNKRKADAQAEISDARIRTVHEKIKAQMEAEVHDRAMEAAKKIIVDGDPEQHKKLTEFLKSAKKIG